MQHIPFYLYILIIALLIGILRFQKLPPEISRLLVPFFFISLLVEISEPLKFFLINGSNHWLMNLFILIEYLILSFFYLRILKEANHKKFVRFAGIMVLLWFSYRFLYVGIEQFDTIGYRISSVVIVLYCIFYFRELMNTEDDLPLKLNPYFWISSGLMFFFMGMFFCLSAFDLIATKYPEMTGRLWRSISFSLNTLMYLFFGISLLCNKPKWKQL